MKKLSILLLGAAVFAAGAYENSAAALKAGNAFRSKKQNKEAIAAYAEAFKLTKHNSEKYAACFYSGVASAGLKDYDTAVSKIRESLQYTQNGNNLSSSQYHIAHYLGVQQKYDQAIAEMGKVKELSKGVSNYYTESVPSAIGRFLIAQKKYKEAVAEAEKGVSSKRTDASVQAWSVIYDASILMKDFSGAEKAVNGLLSKTGLKGADFFARCRLANDFYRRTKKLDLSVKYAAEIENNTELTPFQRALGVYYAAVSYQSMGQKEKALEQWKKLENCNVPHLQNQAKRNISSLTKK